MERLWQKPLEENLYSAILAENIDAVSQLLRQGANPNKTCKHGKTCLGEAANIGNIEILKMLLMASTSDTTSCKPTSCVGSGKKTVKTQKRKHTDFMHTATVAKYRNSNERNYRKNSNNDGNQGYYVFIHNEPSCSQDRRNNSSGPTSSLTPSPQADLEWDEEIGNVAPTTTEDEKWSSMYKWYAAILECTGAAIASASLMSYGIDQQDAYMRTALHYAADQGHISAVKYLLNAGCKVNITACDGLTALHVAVVKNHIEIVTLLLAAGSDVNYKTHDKMTPLHFAASRGFLEMVKLLINNGAFVEARDSNERTPLYLASGRGQADVVQYLIIVGANVNSGEVHGYTPLCEAVWQRYSAVVNILLTSGARITHSHKLLHNAITQRQEDIVFMLANYGAGINLQNDGGDTPLLLATRLSQPSVVRILLEKGANVNALNGITGANALHIAVESVETSHDFEELIKCLLDYKIDMNAPALTGDTPINRALLLHKDNAAFLLIRHGADVNACDLLSCGLDNLSIVCRRRTTHMIQLLLKAGQIVPVPESGKPLPIQGSAAHWLYHAIQQPMSLSDICRIRIRRVLRNKALYRCVPTLPLPKRLKDFLMMEDSTCI